MLNLRYFAVLLPSIFRIIKGQDTSGLNCIYAPSLGSKGSASDAYLDLLRNTLSGLVYAGTEERTLYHGLGNRDTLRKHSVQVEHRVCGVDLPYLGLTMVGIRRLDHLRKALFQLDKDGVKGDVVECGVWQAGASAYIHGVLRVLATNPNHVERKLWLADSFEGFSNPTLNQDLVTAIFPINIWDKVDFIKVSRERVQRNLNWLNLYDNHSLQLVKGYFNDSLPGVSKKVQGISLLRMDGDMYESTMDILYNLYESVQIGGWVIVDDWWIDNCRIAVQEFRARYGITEEIKMIDFSASYWIKQKQMKINASEWIEYRTSGKDKDAIKEGGFFSSVLYFFAKMFVFVWKTVFAQGGSGGVPLSMDVT